jgi:small conductance mechanosensitive channel
MDEKYQLMLVDYGVRIITALVIYIVGKWIAKIITGLVKKTMEKRNIDTALVSFAGNVLYFFLVVVVIVAAITQLGVQTTSLIAMIGAGTLAIGLSLQGSLANLASGVLIVILKPFRIGDVIDAAGAVGSVEDIQLLSTRLKTPDNRVIHIPNGSIMGGPITNITANDTRRVDMVFGIGYDDDVRKTKRILEEIINADDRVLEDPAPVIVLSELADSSVNFNVRPWVNKADYWAVLFDTTESVKLRFDAEGITIPYPQTDVHLHISRRRLIRRTLPLFSTLAPLAARAAGGAFFVLLPAFRTGTRVCSLAKRQSSEKNLLILPVNG